MGNGQTILPMTGKGFRLKARRADACVHHLFVQTVVQVFHADALGVGNRLFRKKFWVEARERLVRLMIQLAIQPQFRVGPDIFQKQAFAPTVMGQNDIRLVPLLFQLQRGAQTGRAADQLGFEIL